MSSSARSRLLPLLAAVAVAAVTGALSGLRASRVLAAGPTHYPVAVVLCNMSDQGGAQELPTAFYQSMFTPGTGGAADYFQQVSRNAADLAGSQVFGPYVIQGAGPSYPAGTAMTLARWNALDRYDKVRACAGAAVDAGVNLSPFVGIISVELPHEVDPAFTPPKGGTTLAAAVSATATTIQVTSAAGFPTPPFPVSAGGELLDVTAEGGSGNTTWTVVRAFEPTDATCAPGQPGSGTAHAAGTQVQVPSIDFWGACQVGRVNNFTVGTTRTQTLNNVGLAAEDPLMNLAVLQHEMGHAIWGLVHSSDLLNQSNYQDAWDMMSAASTYRASTQPAFAQVYNGNPDGYGWSEGPGFNTVYLDNLGWLSPALEATALLSASQCTTTGVRLDPLSILSPAPGDFLEAQLPFTNQPGFPSGQHYTVEFRSPVQGANYTVWDGGVPQTVLIHLAGQNSAFPSYLVDTTVNGALSIQGAQGGGFSGGNPEFVAGSSFVDPASGAFLGVNQVGGSTPTALVTIGNCALPTTLTYVGATSADFGTGVTLAADLATQPGSGPAGPVPNQTVTLTLGSQSCSATTDLNGRAACTVTVSQAPGGISAGASFAGGAAYGGSSTSVPFAITCTVTVSGPAAVVVAVPGVATCITSAFVAGDVTVLPGASLAVSGSSLNGVITSNGAIALQICGTWVAGAVSIANSTGPVLVGDGGDDPATPCAGNTLVVGASFTANQGHLELGGNVVAGAIALLGNTDPGAPPADAPMEVEGNQVAGVLSCSFNTPAPTNDGVPNTLFGGGLDQCGAPGF